MLTQVFEYIEQSVTYKSCLDFWGLFLLLLTPRNIVQCDQTVSNQ
jgi:hypothetical protein